MPATLQSMIDKRANIWSEYQGLLDRRTDAGFDVDTRAALDRMDAELRDLGADIERIQRAERMEAESSVVDRSAVPDGGDDTTRSGGEDPDEQYRQAYVDFLRRGMNGVDAEQRSALMAGFVPGGELRAQGVATDAAGGYFVPTGFRDRIVETMKAWGAVEAVAEVINTATGNDLPWPTNDDTANKGAILAENTAVTEQDVVLGQAQLGAYMYTSKLVRVSLQLLQDSAFDLEGWLPRKFGERLSRATNEHFTTGTGTAQPQGVQTAATAGVTLGTGNTTSLTYDGLIDLIHSVDPAYRASGRARFMLHDTALATTRKLKDSQNRPLWEPSVQAGVPDTLLGYGVTVNQDMPVPAASVKSVLFGDFFAGYVIRRVLGIQSLRLAERYADFLQVGFLAFERVDGKQQDASAYKALVQSAT
jgi:HK97 family phage major capsid protein